VLYGRDPERARLGALLDAALASRSGALLVRGEAGIGKSALLADLRERASDMHVLVASGVESESQLPFAGLHQLLRPALGLLDRIPVRQAAALGGALGLSEASGYERFLVFAACLSLLSELAEERPALCLVDDTHWLDEASTEALSFVARRLDAEGIVIVFAARVGEGRRLELAGIPTLDLSGLDAKAAAAVLARGAGVAAAPAVRDRLLALTRGNALALVELPSALSAAQLAGREPLPDALPLTENVQRAFLERVRRLPEPTQRLLLVAAADDTGRAAIVLRAAEALGADAAALESAEELGLVSVRASRLEFRHPLVRSAVYARASAPKRRAAHRTLAESLAEAGEDDRGTWHVAAAALGPDEQIARRLEEAAGRVSGRGGYEAASRAWERAAALSADDAARGRRLVEAARAALFPGPNDRALELGERALRHVYQPLLRAEIARVLGIGKIMRDSPLEGQRILVDAARDILPASPGKALQLLALTINASTERGDAALLTESCALAATIETPARDDETQFALCLITGIGSIARGDLERGMRLIDEAVRWAMTADDLRHLVLAAIGTLWTADEQRGAALLDRAVSLARTRGALGMLGHALGLRASRLLWRERFEDASLDAHEAVRLAREFGYENIVPPPLDVLAMVAAIRGHDDKARDLAAEAIAIASTHGLEFSDGAARWALAVVDLGRGRWRQSLERLNALAETGPACGSISLEALTAPDRIEAAVRAGMAAPAEDALRTLQASAERPAAAWAQPLLASARALVAESDESRHVDEAVGGPFILGRIHLLHGEHLRRRHRRVDARTHLRAALERFEHIRAAPWAERAREELRATGETTATPEPSTLSQLTPQELHSARLVAQGLSNKEVATQLFLSPRTIDFHMRNVFRKLDITSRTQLARLPLGDEPQIGPTERAGHT
jgi:DNA-binding CsgD family transcriptional regulator/tetratricopeptide (TPR) repeat protein